MGNKEESKDFNGVWMPEEIITMNGINGNEKIILSIVAGLTQKGKCFAKNEYFQDLLGWKKPKYASRVINGLVKRNLLISRTIDDIRYLELGFDLSQKKGMHPPTKRGCTLPQKGEHYNKEDNINNRELSKFNFLLENYPKEVKEILKKHPPKDLEKFKSFFDRSKKYKRTLEGLRSHLINWNENEIKSLYPGEPLPTHPGYKKITFD